MTKDKAKDVIITLMISPIVNGKRRIVLSGAPEQEMPVVRVGTFADLHRLIDEVWLELMKRKQQVVTVKKESAKPKAASKKKSPPQLPRDELKSDQLVSDAMKQVAETSEDTDEAAETPTESEPPEEQLQLPLIEGDEPNGK